MFQVISSFKNPRLYRVNRSTVRNAHKIAVIGGGLAGLSTTYHLLKYSPDVSVTIFDQGLPGKKGASAVAGGLVHPLSPRGKLVYKGLEGLAATNKLVDVAQQFETRTSDRQVVLRDEIYRVALSEKNVKQFRETAEQLPEICEYVDRDKIDPSLEIGDECIAYLRLHSGCKVIHVPSYLDSLWRACQSKSPSVEWKVLSEGDDVASLVQDYETVVLAAGSGLFNGLLGNDALKIQLVRGQSVILSTTGGRRQEAILCGKYISPLPRSDRLLVGATHEFKQEPLSEEGVIEELRDRTIDAAPAAWDGHVLEITEGHRVQSERGRHGRLPIVGRLEESKFASHPNAWIFTGLSSRGLLYHGIFGEQLARAILTDDESVVDDELMWWK